MESKQGAVGHDYSVGRRYFTRRKITRNQSEKDIGQRYRTVLKLIGKGNRKKGALRGGGGNDLHDRNKKHQEQVPARRETTFGKKRDILQRKATKGKADRSP